MLSAESEKLDSSHVPEPAEGSSHLVSPQVLGFLLLGRHMEKYVKSLSAKMMEKTPDLEWVGLVEVRRMASLWMQSMRCCITGCFCTAGNPPCPFLSLSNETARASALGYVKALCCCHRERK